MRVRSIQRIDQFPIIILGPAYNENPTSRIDTEPRCQWIGRQNGGCATNTLFVIPKRVGWTRRLFSSISPPSTVTTLLQSPPSFPRFSHLNDNDKRSGTAAPTYQLQRSVPGQDSTIDGGETLVGSHSTWDDDGERSSSIIRHLAPTKHIQPGDDTETTTESRLCKKRRDGRGRR